jgi:transcriptional regulator with XRE-family HTH domain
MRRATIPGRRVAAMPPDELLRLYPRETLRWLRDRLGQSQLAVAERVGTDLKTVSEWERQRRAISRRKRAQLAALLAPHPATPEGEAFAQSRGRGEANEG